MEILRLNLFVALTALYLQDLAYLGFLKCALCIDSDRLTLVYQYTLCLLTKHMVKPCHFHQ